MLNVLAKAGWVCVCVFILFRDLWLFVEMGSSTLKFEIAIGYRDSYEESWHLLAKGNVSRTLHCEHSSLVCPL